MKKLLFSLLVSFSFLVPAHADETCMSPYMAKIVGQEDYVYVWIYCMLKALVTNKIS